MAVGSVTPINYDLAQRAVVTQVLSTTQFISSGLAQFTDGTFVGYSVWVLSKADGTSTAPKGDPPQAITVFNGSGAVYPTVPGTVTHAALTASLAVGDTVLILHPAIAQIINSLSPSVGINQGTMYYGRVTAVPGANQFTIPALAGMGETKFVNWTAFVYRDAGGAGVAPQGESQVITAYVSTSGAFTAGAFTAAVAVGDEILIIHPRIADIATILTNVNTVNTRVGRSLFQLDFWSAAQEEVQLTAVAGDKALPDITVADLPAGATVVRAIVMFKYRVIENTNAAANKLNGAQDIQIRTNAPGAWNDCINFVDDQFGLAATTREGGDVSIGAIDVAAVVTGNGTYNTQWDEAVADVGNLQFNDVQVGLRVWYSI